MTRLGRLIAGVGSVGVEMAGFWRRRFLASPKGFLSIRRVSGGEGLVFVFSIFLLLSLVVSDSGLEGAKGGDDVIPSVAH